MKTTKSFLSPLLLILPVVLVSSIVLVACSKDNVNNNDNKTYTISGSASGSQMVPSVSGSGTATITGTFNSSTRQLNYTTNWTNLTGAPTFGAFYYGATGVNGAVVGSPWVLGTGLTSTGSFTGSMTLTADQAAQLTSGNWYYVLGTTANATGEVRGQITATPQ
jgi:hypothetical protein